MAPEEQELSFPADDGEITRVDEGRGPQRPGTPSEPINDAPEDAFVDAPDNHARLEGPQVPNGPFFSAQDFENADIRKMADAVDLFRHLGLQKDIELPQLVVIGEQSCGKSSLLESLTKLPFPVAANTCTRFPIEVILRRGAVQEVQVSATQSNPDQTTPALDGFDHRYGPEFNAEKFTECLHDFSVRLGLPLPASADSNTFSSPIRQGIASDALRIEAKHPTYNMLSFVDTPGLIQTGSTDISKDDGLKIQSLIEDLIKKKRTIIIVVQDARHAVENQAAFRLAEEVDPQKERTVGVLTKCDLLNDNTEQERALQLASNTLRPLKNGYFIVRNRAGTERVTEGAISIDQGYDKEDNLFSHEIWRGISPDRLGSRALRTRLAQLFAEHIRAEFPAMQREIVDRLQQSQTTLEDLGPPRTTFEEQKQYLYQVLRKYSRLTGDCIAGRNVDVIQSFPEQNSLILFHRKRLKEDFLHNLQHNGCAYAFIPVSDAIAGKYDADAGRSLDDARPEINRARDHKNIYTWINSWQHLAPLPSCCGVVSHERLLSLFRHQILPWKKIATGYISEIAAAIDSFVHHALKEVSAAPAIAESLRKALINAVEKVKISASASLVTLYELERTGMETSDPQFEAQCSSNRAIRLGHALSKLQRRLDGDGLDQLTETVDIDRNLMKPHVLSQVLSQPRGTVYETHDILHAYYRFAEKRSRDNVIQIADSLMFSTSSIISAFDADWIDELTPEDAKVICGEDAQTRDRRRQLGEQIKRFENAIEQVGVMIPSCRLNLVGRDDIPESENRRATATRSAFNVQSSSQDISGSTLALDEGAFQVPGQFQTAENPTFTFEPIYPGHSKAAKPLRARFRGGSPSPEWKSSPSPSGSFRSPSSMNPSASTKNKGESTIQTGFASASKQSQTASERGTAVAPERSTPVSSFTSHLQSAAFVSPLTNATARPAGLFGSNTLSTPTQPFSSTASSTFGTPSPSPFSKLEPPPTNAFGTPAAKAVGTTPSTPIASSMGLFGRSATTASAPFGAPAANAFGTTASSHATPLTGVFGRPASNELGATPSTSGTSSTSPFGGGGSTANAFGTMPGTSKTALRAPFGQFGGNGSGTV